MADPTDKAPENAPGKFYCDATCIDCNTCRETAPELFTRSDEEGQSYVHRQPLTPEEFERALDAMEMCPVGAIGNDGEEE
jgi:ferredoxin